MLEIIGWKRSKLQPQGWQFLAIAPLMCENMANTLTLESFVALSRSVGELQFVPIPV